MEERHSEFPLAGRPFAPLLLTFFTKQYVQSVSCTSELLVPHLLLKHCRELPALDKSTPALKVQQQSEASSSKESKTSLNNVETGSAAKGSVFGAMALITGTSVGAGMLALPATTAPAVSTFLLASW